MIRRDDIQAIYPLMQKQRVLAYYSLQTEHLDPGFIQLRFVIKGPLHTQSFSQAWQTLVQRHESLRMSLQSPKQKQSMIVVSKSCVLPVEWVDMRGDTREGQDTYIEHRLTELHKNGLDLADTPVHRLLGVRTDESVTEFFWALHHIFLDGWSAIVLLNDLAQTYSHERSATPLPQAQQSTHSDYLEWLSVRAPDAANYWSEKLNNYSSPVLVGDYFGCTTPSANQRMDQNGSSGEFQELLVNTDTALGAAIDQLAVQQKVTSATIVYVAWAIYLAALSKTDDVVFGTTSAGRTFDLPDSQIMTGYFANVIPRRYQLDHLQVLRTFISQSHHEGFSSLAFEHLPIDEIQRYSNVPLNQPLFDSIVLFENLPLDDIELPEPDGPVTMGSFSGGLTSTYPLTLTVRPGTQWRFKYLFAPELIDAGFQQALTEFPDFLLSICEEPEKSVGGAYDWIAKRLVSLVSKPDVESLSLPIESNLSKQLARNATELAVALIWEDLLGITEIDVHTEFIALGGRSIAAVRMLAAIQDRFGVKLSMRDMVEQPTIAALAGLIDGNSAKSNWRSLIPLKPGGNRPAVIIVHGGAGHVLFMRSLTGYFDKDRPVIGMQLVGLDGECEPMNTIPDIANHFLQEILTYQPEGPYYFIGHCFGVAVVHELVHMLHKRGKEVALVVALDAEPPLSESKKSSISIAISLLKESGDAAPLIKYLTISARVIKNVCYRLGQVAHKCYQRFVLLLGNNLAKNQIHMELVYEACIEASYSYFAKPVNQKVILISCEGKVNPPIEKWSEMAKEIEVITLPVGHITMFTEPEVATLGKTLSNLVERHHSHAED